MSWELTLEIVECNKEQQKETIVEESKLSFLGPIQLKRKWSLYSQKDHESVFYLALPKRGQNTSFKSLYDLENCVTQYFAKFFK